MLLVDSLHNIEQVLFKLNFDAAFIEYQLAPEGDRVLLLLAEAIDCVGDHVVRILLQFQGELLELVVTKHNEWVWTVGLQVLVDSRVVHHWHLVVDESVQVVAY